MKVNISRRKRSVTIENHDSWSLDHTLSDIILPCLLQLKEKMTGIPGIFGLPGGGQESLQYSFDFYSETYDDAFNITCEQWEETIDKMIWSFQQLVYDNYFEKYDYGKWEMKFDEIEETHYNPITKQQEKLYQLRPVDPDKYWMDHEGLAMHEERIQEGIDLFAKYYRSLWT